MEVEEAIIDLIRSRRDVGRKKYGVPMERGDLSLSQWITHAIEEALDLANYLEAARRKIVEQDAEIADLRAKLAAIQKAMGHPTTEMMTVGEPKTAKKAPPTKSQDQRTQAEVLAQRRSGPSGACCDRYADNQACDCLTDSQLRDHQRGSEYPHCSLCGNGFPYVDSMFGHDRCHKCREEHGTGCSICSNRNCDNPGGKH